MISRWRRDVHRLEAHPEVTESQWRGLMCSQGSYGARNTRRQLQHNRKLIKDQPFNIEGKEWHQLERITVPGRCNNVARHQAAHHLAHHCARHQRCKRDSITYSASGAPSIGFYSRWICKRCKRIGLRPTDFIDSEAGVDKPLAGGCISWTTKEVWIRQRTIVRLVDLRACYLDAANNIEDFSTATIDAALNALETAPEGLPPADNYSTWRDCASDLCGTLFLDWQDAIVANAESRMSVLAYANNDGSSCTDAS